MFYRDDSPLLSQSCPCLPSSTSWMRWGCESRYGGRPPRRSRTAPSAAGFNTWPKAGARQRTHAVALAAYDLTLGRQRGPRRPDRSDLGWPVTGTTPRCWHRLRPRPRHCSGRCQIRSLPIWMPDTTALSLATADSLGVMGEVSRRAYPPRSKPASAGLWNAPMRG